MRADVAVVTVTGEVDVAARSDLAGSLFSSLEPTRGMVVDLSGVTFMDSSGLHVVLDACARRRAAGRGFALRNPSPQVVRLLEVAGLDDLVPSRPGPQDADLGGRPGVDGDGRART